MKNTSWQNATSHPQCILLFCPPHGVMKNPHDTSGRWGLLSPPLRTQHRCAPSTPHAAAASASASAPLPHCLDPTQTMKLQYRQCHHHQRCENMSFLSSILRSLSYKDHLLSFRTFMKVCAVIYKISLGQKCWVPEVYQTWTVRFTSLGAGLQLTQL